MKRILATSICIISSFFFVSCLGSKVPQDTPLSKIADFENVFDKGENFVLANEWMVETFNDAQSVIQFTDKESGIVKGKYTVRNGYVSTSPYVASVEALYSIITIRVKENSCRIEIDPPNVQFYSQMSMGNEFGYTTAMFDESTNKLITDFQRRMQGQAIWK
jgi:hypothetical protein